MTTPITLPRVINAAGHLSMLGGGVTRADLARESRRRSNAVSQTRSTWRG